MRGPSTPLRCAEPRPGYVRHAESREAAVLALYGFARSLGKLKANSSRWVRQEGPRMKRAFAWQRGYGAFSVSESNTPAVVEYIRGQPEHHRKVSFDDELRRLFERHGLEVDGMG